jgi:hydrogenase maturation factor
MAIRGVAMGMVGLIGAMKTLGDDGLTGGMALLLTACVALVAAAIYDWRMLQTMRMPNNRDITLTKSEVDELLGPPGYTVSSRAMHQSTGSR